MKVYIGKYPNPPSLWHFIEKVPVSEKTQDKIWDWFQGGLIDRALVWYAEKQKRTINVRIDPYDTWNMDSTLSPIILPMLKQLKATKHGSPMVDEEDLPAHMQHEGENWVHYKWDWVLNEMIWAFEQLNDPDWEEKFIHGTPEYSKEEEEEIEGYGLCWSIKQINPDYWVDYQGMKEYNARIMNGTRLFGKYYQNLWD